MIRNSRRILVLGSSMAMALLLLSCGKDAADSPGSSVSARQDEQFAGGKLHQAQLLPLNPEVAGESLGILSWEMGSSVMRVNLSMTNTPENLEHFQGLHAGSQCPSEKADSNLDGIIDMAELEKVSGARILDLSSNLTLDKADFSTSRANDLGNYTYWSEVNIRDLRKVSLPFSPENKVVVVYGINPHFNLPASAFSYQGSQHRYIPISCGVIRASSIQNLH